MVDFCFYLWRDGAGFLHQRETTMNTFSPADARRLFAKYGFFSDCPVNTPLGAGYVLAEGSTSIIIKLLEPVQDHEVVTFARDEISLRA
jgi:hypothetical protein